MKVKLLTSVAQSRGVWNAGDEYECASAEEAARFIERGIAAPIREEKIERAIKSPKRKEVALRR